MCRLYRLHEAASAVRTRHDVRDFGGHLDDRAEWVRALPCTAVLWDELGKLNGHALDVDSCRVVRVGWVGVDSENRYETIESCRVGGWVFHSENG